MPFLVLVTVCLLASIATAVQTSVHVQPAYIATVVLMSGSYAFVLRLKRKWSYRVFQGCVEDWNEVLNLPRFSSRAKTSPVWFLQIVKNFLACSTKARGDKADLSICFGRRGTCRSRATHWLAHRPVRGNCVAQQVAPE